ncbi:hypothetical protein DFJ73DRAFT_901188 [Zopfochytrium polystomum]|nr:hypothetical protein DFJ73DRAFT_901188 [Zopfochytrium polystomum]
MSPITYELPKSCQIVVDIRFNNKLREMDRKGLKLDVIQAPSLTSSSGPSTPSTAMLPIEINLSRVLPAGQTSSILLWARLIPQNFLFDQTAMNGFCAFKHEGQADDQSVSSIEEYLALFRAVAEASIPVVGGSAAYGFSADQLSRIFAALSCLEGGRGTGLRGCLSVLMWLPQYACVLYSAECGALELQLHLCALDGWKYSPQLAHNATVHHLAVSSHCNVLVCETVPTALKNKVLDKLNDLLGEAACHVGNNRSAARASLGHQHTPSFVQAILSNAVDAVVGQGKTADQCLPCGGTTDVGLHTGGLPRSTSYRLVVRMIATFLCDPFLFEKLLLHKYLAVFENRLSLLEDDTDFFNPRGVDECAMLLDMAVGITLKLHDAKRNCDGAETIIADNSRRLKTYIADFGKTGAARYEIQWDALKSCDFTNLSKFWPELNVQTAQSFSPEQAHSKLQHFDMLDTFEFRAVDRWYSNPLFNTSDPSPCLAASATVSKFFYEHWLDSGDSEHLTFAAQRSEELLIVWIGTCLVHQHLTKTCSLIRGYACVLDDKLLAYLSLRDKFALDACSNVRNYLRRVNSGKLGTLFSLTKPQSTIEFARHYAAADPTMKEFWREELRECKRKETCNFDQVTEKQRMAAGLRDDISRFNTEVTAKANEIQRLSRSQSETYYRSQLWNNLAEKIKHASRQQEELQASLNAAKYELELTLRPPPFIKHPWHRSSEVPKAPENPESQYPQWILHYEKWKAPTRSFTPKDSHFPIVSRSLKVPNDLGPFSKSVDNISSPEQCSWYPDFSSTLSSPDGTDPGSAQLADIVNYFEEKLPKTYEPLQWFVNYPEPVDKPSSRGNRSIASIDHLRDLKLANHQKEDYLLLGIVRSFPNQQFRKVLEILSNLKFPLSHEVSTTTLWQALLQLGKANESGELIWRKEWDFGKDSLHAALMEWVNLFSASSKRYADCLPVAQIAEFSAQHICSETFEVVLLKICNAALTWAAEIREKICRETTLDAVSQRDLRARECMMMGHATLCHSRSTVNVPSTASFTKAFAVFRALLPHGSFKADMAKTLRRLEILALDLASSRFASSAKLAETNAHEILTPAARAVFDQLPEVLSWQGFGGCTGCFYAVANGDIVSINMLEGVVHLNGLPPAGLPQSVRGSAFYKRHFGSRDFQVSRTGFSFGTSLPIYGDHYRFCICENEQIRIRQLPETDNDWNYCLELLDFNCQPRMEWWADLPVRLQKMHSHWISSALSVVLLRGVRFPSKEIQTSFLVSLEDDDGTCYAVSHFDQNKSLEELVSKRSEYDKMIRPPAEASLLWARRFEFPQFVHFLQTPRGFVRAQLPRFRLGFSERESNDRRLYSDEYAGYFLDNIGNLDNFLPGFYHYLVLRPVQSDQPLKLIVPDGQVVVQDGNTTINCWTNKPLSVAETEKIENILQFAHPEPALCIAASELRDFSERTAFLFSPSTSPATSASFRNLKQFSVAKSEYGKKFEQRNEEFRPSPLQSCPVKALYVRERETELKKLLIRKGKSTRNDPVNRPFPLKDEGENRVERTLYRDLRKSWDSFCQADAFELPKDIDRLKADIGPSVLGILANPLFTDYLRIAMHQEALGWLQPYLSSEQRVSLRRGILVLLALGVLEEKLVRIGRYLEDPAFHSHAIRELLAAREWNIEKFYFWLVFEVEAGLQIRPEQHLIAQHLIDTPQAICQLNMGLGKTRVILPMLVLHFCFADSKPENTVLRLNFLQALIPEAVHYLTSTFAASVIPMKIYETFEMLCGGGGCVVVSPEHRLSLQLKCRELQSKNDPLWEGLSTVLATHFFDVIDESDEVLSHKYHLVYAMGAPHQLDDGFKRWSVVESIFRVVAKLALQYSMLWNQTQASSGLAAGSFREIKVKLAASQDVEGHWKRLFKSIVDELLDNPPHRFTELKRLGTLEKVHFRKCVLSSSVEATKDEFGMCAEVGLALRGFLSHGLLRHVLQLRHRVNYGIDDRRYAKKIAVPYRAADVPSDRAEFGHPDVSIALTFLSYYYRGLSLKEFKEAITALLKLGQVAQESFYDEWFTLVKHSLSDADASKMNSVQKIDPSDEVQLSMLHRVYAKNFEAINFWLQSCVFPRDTTQFKERIAATAWDLASADHCCGFSGTNDSYPLLPLQVKQSDPNIDLIVGTNGLMLDRIIRETRCYTTLRSNNATAAVWQQLLQLCTANNANALIDAGSLLAGTDNEALAEFIVNHASFPSKFRGVCYFDVRKQCWIILNKQTLEKLRKELSSIPERDTFVIFDDARTRGADMKLPHDAVAVLTLGPAMVKDKLMQGAGRMRMLGTGQKLILCGTSEVTSTLRSQSDRVFPTVEEVLKWVIRNTAERIITGMPLWAENGLRFDDNRQDVDNYKLKEIHGLDRLYAPSASSRLLTTHIEEMVNSRKCSNSDIQENLVRRAYKVAQGVQIQVLRCDDECERELLKEEERESEPEKQIPLKEPAMEETWNYNTATQACRASELDVESQAVPLGEGLQKLIGASAAEIDWSLSVYTTANFLSTIQLERKNTFTNQSLYLRPPLGVLVFHSTSELVLLSDKEADGVLWAFHSAPASLLGNTSFCYLSDLWIWANENSQPRPAMAVGSRHLKWKRLPETSIASAKLFNGDTMYGSIAGSLQHLLRSQLGQRAARDLVEYRSKENHWERSQLQAACGCI